MLLGTAESTEGEREYMAIEESCSGGGNEA